MPPPAAATAAAARRGTLSLTSWFHHPALDMGFRWEPLSRGSATLLRLPDGGAGGRLALALSHHVAAPFRVPRLYAPEGARAFLSQLSEARVRCSLELRCAETGRVRARVRLRPPRLAPVLGHAGGRDVAAVAVREAELAALAALAEAAAGAPLSALEHEALAPLELPRAGAAPPAEGEALGFSGHFLLAGGGGGGGGGGAGDAGGGAGGDTDGNGDGDGDGGGGAGAYLRDSSRLLPRDVGGLVLLRSSRQVFARTRELLEEGMCGGAVVRVGGGVAIGGSGGGGGVECVGIIEGIVPAAPPAPVDAAAETGPAPGGRGRVCRGRRAASLPRGGRGRTWSFWPRRYRRRARP